MDVDGVCSIIQVDIVRRKVDDGSVLPLDTLYVELQEVVRLKEQFVANMWNRAQSLVVEDIVRLTYVDEEGDWCTLSKDTLDDAMSFIVPVEAGGGVGKLQICAVCEDLQKAATMTQTKPQAAKPACSMSTTTPSSTTTTLLAPLEEFAGMDFPGDDIKNLPCESLERAREIAQEHIAGSPDLMAAWCESRKQIWIKSNAVDKHPCQDKLLEGTEDEHITLFFARRPVLQQQQAPGVAPRDMNVVAEAPAWFLEQKLGDLSLDCTRSALAGLLQHPDTSVRMAAAAAIIAEPIARQAPAEDAPDPTAEPTIDKPSNEEEPMIVEATAHERQPIMVEETGVEDAASSTSSEFEMVTVSPFSPEERVWWAQFYQPASARVMVGSPLVLGIEAQEEEAVRGDITEEFAGVVASAGASQAFRMGRMLLPAGGSSSVPACAKVVVQNDGQVQWPETTIIAVVSGDSLGFPQMPLGAMQPGEAAEVVFDLLVPAKSEPGATRSTWAILDGATGTPLGPLLFFETVWLAQ